MTKSKVFLLDANILIALATPDHTAHDRAVAWFRAKPRFATCPVTQGALIRFQMRWAVTPSIAGTHITAAKDLLRRICALPLHEFWPDDATYLNLPERGIVGHRQITDAYLVSMAALHDATLATMDEALAAIHPNQALLIPRQ